MRLFYLKVTVCSALLCMSMVVHSQKNTPVKFGKVQVQDFDLSAHTIDSSVAAVIIADVGETTFLGNAHGGFSIDFER